MLPKDPIATVEKTGLTTYLATFLPITKRILVRIILFSCSGDRDRYVGRCSLVFFALLLSASPTPAVDPVNSWIKSGSGYWEELSSWSLGVLPDQSQSVAITNAGWKAVAVGTNAAQNFPASMQIKDLQIASPVDSFNVFLMNFSGFQMPLKTTSLNVGSNSSVVVQSSSLEVIKTDTNGATGNILLDGTFNHGDFSLVKVHGRMDISRFSGTGAYFMTNGTLSVNSLSMGGFFKPGKFVQYGGANNVGGILVFVEGEYDIYGGQLTATNGITIGDGDFATSSSFYQYGGSVNGDMVVNGHYFLNGGIRTGRLTAPSDTFQRVEASILQSGGTNSAVSMDLGYPNRFGGAISYVLSNGVVRVDSSTIFRGGWFNQYNGLHTIVSNLVMQGRDVGVGNIHAEYNLKGGTLSVGGLTEQVARFTQEGGTNSIAGALVLNPTPPFQSTWYTLGGGTLFVKDIFLHAGTFFGHIGGNIIHSGLLTLSQGEWRAAAPAQSLGPLQLTVGTSNNSAITFSGGPSTLRLADSSAQPWVPSAILYINNWHGSTSGGGATQLYFGSNASGLTSQQLAQIRFALSGGLSPAKILATGEVVPVATPRLEFTRSGGTMTLSWPSGWFLQSATNVTGPYNDVSGATSPRPVTITSPQQFFRLRQ